MTAKPFLFGHEQQFRDLIADPRSIDLSDATCAGVDTGVYHPEGDLDELSVARCSTCPARLRCLAYAMGLEDANYRSGWYGGLGPSDRDTIASELKLTAPQYHPSDKGQLAVQLRGEGLTVSEIATRLMCSRRTVQRYLRTERAQGPTTTVGDELGP